LEASIDLLEPEDKLKLLQLGIFPEDEEIPYRIAKNLWELNEFDTEELLLKLHKLGLIDLDFPGKIIKIHDVLLRYYAENLQNIKQLHCKLSNKLGDFHDFKKFYQWQYYLWHLQQAGEKERAVQLLRNLEWIEAKLFATNINQLLHHYEYFTQDENCNLIHKAFRLPAHVLAEDKSQVAAQIIGRLGYFENEIIEGLVDKAGKWQNQTIRLKVVKPTLQPPGYLQRIFKGHSSSVNGVLIRQKFGCPGGALNNVKKGKF
jgi:hypothetical protein